MTLDMGALRELHGAGKLGVHVRSGISDKLRQNGIGHYPSELPTYQWDQVRLYKQGTPVGRVIEAVFTVGEDGDAILRESAGSDADEILVRVRELVC